MEQAINRLLQWLRVEMGLAVAILLAAVALGIQNMIPNGLLCSPDQARTAYWVNIIAVVLTLAGSGLSLKLFHLNTTDNLRRYTLDTALLSYHHWSIARLLGLLVAALFGIVAYFLTLSDIGLYCALMVAILAAIYCIPSKQKIKDYLEAAQRSSD